MHADLVQLGFDGSYERVAAFVREWKGERQRATHTTGRGTFVPLVFQPGEAFQFDWSEDWAYVGGERIKLQVAHMKLSHSARFSSGPICCRHMRCYSMPIGTGSASSRAFLAAASTTT
jgi:hypothetical protein